MEASFPQFSKLPYELQLLIWEAVFDQLTKQKQQVINGQPVNHDKTRPPSNQHLWYMRTHYNHLLVFPGAQKEAIPPAILSVCHTSRQVALRRPKFTNLILNPHNLTSGPVWFDFHHDIVMLSRLKANSYGLNIEWLKVKNKETLHKIRRIAVPWSAFHAGQQRFLTQIERDARWRLLLGNLRGLFPNLTDIFLFIPVVRQLPSYDSSSDRHSQEPAKCKSLRPRLEHILENYDVVKLPACDCLEKPSTLGEAICEIRSVLEPEDGNELDWVYRDWRQSLKVHGRWLAREGLDMDSLRGVPGIEVEKAFCKEARRETEDCNI